MTDDSGTPPPDDRPRADFGDETRKLMLAVQDWARRAFPEPPGGHGGPECQWCPLCQFASVVRGERPEVTDRMAEAGTALAKAFKALVDTAASYGQGAPADGAPRGNPRPAPRVQRINLEDTDPGAGADGPASDDAG